MRKIFDQSFRTTGISSPVDEFAHFELAIKGFAPGKLIVGDWACPEEADEIGFGTSENENTKLLPPDSSVKDEALEFPLIDE